MKIIAGEAKGRPIEMPRNVEMRPTSDKVREALFNIIAQSIPGSSVLDLFAGSGSLGLEALSRGAERAVFVDEEKRCVSTIRKNVSILEFEGKDAKIYRNDALKAVKKLSDSNSRFDIVFMDPPYYGDWVKKCLLCISKYDILNHPSLIICEHFKKDVVPEGAGSIKLERQARYGDTVLSIYAKKGNEKSSIPGVI